MSLFTHIWVSYSISLFNVAKNLYIKNWLILSVNMNIMKTHLWKINNYNVNLK